MRISKRKGLSPNVDMTPMIDIVFQLILFFLVSTTFAVLPAISVNLPESSTAQGAEIDNITITASEDGKLWFNEDEVTMKTLGKKLASFDTGDKKREEYPITLEADDKVTNGTIVKLFDVIRENGFAAVNLRTRGVE